MRSIARSSAALLLALSASGAPAGALVHPLCPWCGASQAPPSTGPSSRIAPAGEPGTPLVITGTVLQPDGRTPVGGVMIYAYHTNARGAYPTRGDEPTGTEGHGYLRGWARTDSAGHYRFVTIRPAPAAGRGDPALIRMTVRPAGGRESVIDPLMFDDDTLLTADARARLPRTAGAAVVHPVTDARGMQHVVRDIVLERGS